MLNIQRLCIIFLTFSIALSVPEAQDEPFEEWDPYFERGDVSYSAAVGFSTWWGRFGLSLTPAAEAIIHEYRIGEVVPLSFGIAGLGNATTDLRAAGADLGVTVAGLGTAHLGFKNVSEPLEWLEKFDVYIGLGPGFEIIQPDWYNGARLRLASMQGTNYFIRENFAVFLENTYLGRYRNYFSAGVRWKI
ncbi:MAG: hypothetical protein ACLFVQ_05940 [Chitinispirillaceae bacterium]